jgi:hypothetical protein
MKRNFLLQICLVLDLLCSNCLRFKYAVHEYSILICVKIVNLKDLKNLKDCKSK